MKKLFLMVLCFMMLLCTNSFAEVNDEMERQNQWKDESIKTFYIVISESGADGHYLFTTVDKEKAVKKLEKNYATSEVPNEKESIEKLIKQVDKYLTEKGEYYSQKFVAESTPSMVRWCDNGQAGGLFVVQRVSQDTDSDTGGDSGKVPDTGEDSGNNPREKVYEETKYKYKYKHSYGPSEKDRTDKEEKLTANLYPNREENKDKGKESLYMNGDILELSGYCCTHVTEKIEICIEHVEQSRTETCSTFSYPAHSADDCPSSTCPGRGNTELTEHDGFTDPNRYMKYGEWADTGLVTEGCGWTREEIEKNSSKNRIESLIKPNKEEEKLTITKYKVEIDFKGFKVNGKNHLTVEPNSDSSWSIANLQIDEVSGVTYDSTRGAYYGNIDVSCACCQGGHSKSFKLYFGDRGVADQIVDLKVKVTPNAGGVAKITGYMDTDNDGKVEKDLVTVSVTGEQTLRVVSGNNYKIEAIGSNGYQYKWITTLDGNIISEANPYDYMMPAVNTVIVVHFTPSNSNGYTLYVSSNEGGKAETKDRPAGTSYEQLTTKLGTQEVLVDKISGVKVGTEFKLEYEAKEGYEFDRWEFRPFINGNYDRSTNITTISMPASDLTATAIFKKVSVEKENPILKVTSNNEDWGTVYVKDKDGNTFTIDEAIPGQEYTIVVKENSGYYFTNYEYDSDRSPFTDAKNGKIIMPNYDLEITGLFAPIPETDDQNNSVTFKSETLTPEDGIIPGTVPTNLDHIVAGAEVTFGVTANNGYEFVYWYFRDTNNNIITPDNEYTEYGSGKFVMPDYSVVAIAVFKKTDYSNLKIEIIGEGKVTADDEEVPNATIISVVTGDYVELVAEPKEGWKFVHWTDEDGNVISDDDEIFYKVEKDTTIKAVFAKKQKYTLYVTSMGGGEAATTGNENHPENTIIKTVDALNKTVYEIRDVYEGENFEIYYTTNIGYEFEKWEYKPYIQPESDKRNSSSGKITITMPASDLTVTAVFKNSSVTSKPLLKITTNNANWGTAWTNIDGKSTSSDKEYSADVGKDYKVYFESKPGYYFVNWDYSTEKSPFIDDNLIKMPSSNLEVMAFFSPIQEPDDPYVPQDDKYDVEFLAEPPEGGKVPENLVGDKKILPGSKVTVGVTPNVGWEFDYWYFKDESGNEVEVECYFDSEGSGYFIMPAKDIKAIAVFKKAKVYKLYVTYTAGGTAWVIDNNVKSDRIDNAIPESIYNLGYEADNGYEFVGWEIRWDNTLKNPNPETYQKTYPDRVIMPYSDMTVTAKFEKTNEGDGKIRVISNNYLWGDVGIYVDGNKVSWKEVVDGKVSQNASGATGVAIEPDKEYTIWYSVEEGYKFDGWKPTDYLTEYPTSDEGYWEGTIKVTETQLKKDIELVGYFAPQSANESYDLTVKSDPSGAAIVSGDKSNIKYGEEYTVKVKKLSTNYEFEYWYYINSNGRKVICSSEESYSGKMPNNDLELIAYCRYTKSPETPEPTPDDKIYNIVVKIEGIGYVTDEFGTTVTVKEMKDGESIMLNATPGTGYEFAGWLRNGKIVSTSSKEIFTINGESITVTACFKEKLSGTSGDSFKIISVRDLRWKDYFVDNDSSLTGNVFNVPKEGTMLKQVNNYPEVIKMGYGVEFELTTSQLVPENTVIVIEPKIINNGEEIDWSDVEDYTKDGKDKDIDDSFKKIVIYGNGAKNNYTNKYQTSVKEVTYENNGVNINKMVWNWIYYLPGDIFFTNWGRGNDDITIRFDIQIHECPDGKTYSSTTLKERLVKFEQTYNGTSWKGDVYKYSKKDSLFDDIYNNAQN